VTRRLALLVAAILGAGPALLGQQRPVFRTTADLVTIDVAVRSRNTPVSGLTAEDFEVADDGVRQQVEMLDATSLPIDLTVVLDVSGSMMALVGPMTKYANSVLDILQADDRLRIIKVGTYVSQPVGFSRAAGQLEVEEIEPGEMTSLYDGLAAAMMRSREPDRRHVIVALTDGIDTTSSLELSAVEGIARRTDAVLYVVRPEYSGTGPFPDRPLRADTRNRWMMPRVRLGLGDDLGLAPLAEVTGGRFERVYATPGGLPSAVKIVLDTFRHSYVLRYHATGVTRAGWHDVTVKLPKHDGVEIRARKGYFGG
jgi:VWFA-related protein